MKNKTSILFFAVCLSFLIFNCDTEANSFENIEITQQDRIYKYVIKEAEKQLMFLTDNQENEFLRLFNLAEYAIVEYNSIINEIQKEDDENSRENEEKLEQQLNLIIEAINKLILKINEIINELEDIYTSADPDEENEGLLSSIYYSIKVLLDINSMLESVSLMPSPNINSILNKYFTGMFYLFKDEYRREFYQSEIIYFNLENMIAKNDIEDLNVYINNEMIPLLNKTWNLYWIGSTYWNNVYLTLQRMKIITSEYDNIDNIRLAFFEENN